MASIDGKTPDGSEPVAGSRPRTAPRVLIIDDDVAIRRLLVRLVGSAHIHADTAAGVAEAIALISAGRFDLALCDMHMPGSSGLDFLRAAGRVDPSLPVVMMSGANDGETMSAARAAGARAFVAKPVERAVLISTIRQHHRSASVAIE